MFVRTLGLILPTQWYILPLFRICVYARIYLCMCVLCCALNVKWWCSKFPTPRGTIGLGLEIHGNGSFYKGSSSTTSIDTAYVGTNINIRICMPYNVAVYGLQAALL